MDGEHRAMVILGCDINTISDMNTHHGCVVNVVDIFNVAFQIFLGT